MLAVGVAAGLVIAGHVHRHAAVLNLSTSGLKWSDALTAIATASLVVVTGLAALFALREYQHHRSDAQALAVSRCDVSIDGICFTYRDRHLLRLSIAVRNRSTSKLEFVENPEPPFVMVHAVPDELLAGQLTSNLFEGVQPLAAVEVLAGQFLEADENLAHTVLIPVTPQSVAAYRVEFGISVKDPIDQEPYEWRAVNYLPVGMRTMYAPRRRRHVR